jgi:uncharacterized protein YoxC
VPFFRGDSDQNGHRSPRLDQLEKLMDLLIADHQAFSDEHKKLLTRQVLLTDGLTQLKTRVDKLAESIKELTEAQKHTDERMSALIGVVDQLVRDKGGKSSA